MLVNENVKRACIIQYLGQDDGIKPNEQFKGCIDENLVLDMIRVASKPV
jgi:hypothetical protein